MNRDELEKRNVGENLDTLMNLDPRGYGVCRILYAGSRKATGEPLTMHAAQTLVDAVKPGDLVFFKTGSGESGLHVGIYDTDNQFIHASTSQGVTRSSLDNVYWHKKFWQARRI